MILTFSTKFPAYHPKKGESTYFVQKILAGLLKMETKGIADAIYETGRLLRYNDVDSFLYDIEQQTPKYHTIRAGHRFKAGDTFSPRIWSGRPYNSKQIVIAPDIRVEKTWDFDIGGSGLMYVNDENLWIQENYCIENVAKNDGLSVVDFMDWFQYPKPFDGQIICWDNNINY